MSLIRDLNKLVIKYKSTSTRFARIVGVLEDFTDFESSMFYIFKGDDQSQGLFRVINNSTNRIVLESTRKEHKFEGITRMWNNDGILEAKVHYKNGKREGHLEMWHEDGKIAISQYYMNDKLNGLKEEWLSNGRIIERSNYKDDKLDGLREIWDENGKQTNRSIWENGVMIKEI